MSVKSQVIAITHSPQVAALCDQHYFVEKSGTPVNTSIILLDEEQKTLEVARMISGDTITDEAKNAAKKLRENGYG
jgi:DNA repair protein RecN (Recombination protein N)